MLVKSIFRDIDLHTAPSWDSYLLNSLPNRNPNNTALIDLETGKRFTFAQVQKDIKSIACGLHALGIKKGDIVAVCLPNCSEYISIVLAILSRGAIYCGINPNYTPDEFEYNINDCTAQIIFASKESLENIDAACRKLGGKQKIYVVGDDVQNSSPNVKSYKELFKYTTTNLPPISIDPKSDVACILYSSGTTGRPKGVMLSHGALVAASQLTFNGVIYHIPSKGDHFIAMLPFFHIMGLIVTFDSFRTGAILVVMRKYGSEKLLKAIQDYKVRVLACVPPMLVFLAKDALVDKYDLTSLRHVLVGAAPVGKELTDEVMTRLPRIDTLGQGYGMTEISAACFLTPKWQSKSGSCGLLVPNYTCKVVDATGKACGPHGLGEICIDGPSHMLGYLNNQKATKESYDKDGFYRTGDIGYYDEEGCFFIVDRVKELIKVKGFQVSPAELEDLLLSHPSVQDAAIIGIPDMAAGEIPKAFVVKKPSIKIDENELMQFVNERTINYKHLKGGIEFVDEIPKSPSGKILRRVLQEREKEKATKAKM